MTSVEPILEASLGELVKGSAFEEICQSFRELVEVPIRVYDSREVVLADATTTQPPCEYICTFDTGRRKCAQKRLEVKKAAGQSEELFDIDCFCGLRYKIAPIFFQGTNMGKIVIGPYLPASLERVPENTREIDARLELSSLSQRFGDMLRLNEDIATKIVNTTMAVTQVVLFSAQKAHLTSEMHIATIRESYRELTKKNQELEDLAEERREFERIKANFLSTVSHELRTPLTSIIGYSDMLVEGIGGELKAEQRQFVDTIKTKGDELLKLIGSILDFSQLDAGHMQLELADIDPSELINEAVESRKEIASRRGITLSTHVANNLSTVRIDPDKIRTAIGHLIENAIKFSSPGGIIKVSARRAEADESEASEDDGIGFVLMSAPEMLELLVEDYGLGIADADKARIFSPFTQLDNSSTREHGGAGLGLAVVKHYVEAHGGRINVTSHEGKGTSFSIRLPL